MIEIWNLVFMKFNREDNSQLTSLPDKHVDTGMGFERLVSVLENKRSNYDTEIFTPIFEEIQKLTQTQSYTGKIGKNDVDQKDTAYRVIADHIRTLCIAIADGGRFGPTGQNYVLRRILRRAVRYGRIKLGAQPGFFNQLVPVTLNSLMYFFPEISVVEEFIRNIIQQEEKIFETTLKKGEAMFKNEASQLTDIFPVKSALKLWKTYGFPFDLISLMSREYGLTLDQKECITQLALESSTNKNSDIPNLTLCANAISYLHKKNIPVTYDSFKYRSYYMLSSQILAIWDVSTKKFITSSEEAENQIGIILSQTIFYAEGGGQICDIGQILSDNDTCEIEINHVKSFAGYILHFGKVKTGNLCVSTHVKLKLNECRRQKIATNHTATHLLNFALQKVLGCDIEQKSSLVSDEKFRFDFSYPKKLNSTQLYDIQQLCNTIIQDKLPVYTQTLALKTALLIPGLKYLKDEHYPNQVRVVSIGTPIAELGMTTNPTSIELCSGIHVNNTKDLQYFCVLHQSTSGSDVQRIIAVTGSQAKSVKVDAERLYDRLENAKTLNMIKLESELKIIKKLQLSMLLPLDTSNKISVSIDSMKKFLVKANEKIVFDAIDIAKNLAREHQNTETKFTIVTLDAGDNQKGVNDAAKIFSELNNCTAACFISKGSNNILVNCVVPQKLVNYIKANEWALHIVSVCGGKGGGNNMFAAGKGVRLNMFDHLIKSATEYVTFRLN